jgi:hypothetical protein
MSNSSRTLVPLLVLPYLAWRVYRRFHRNVGRQLVHSGRLVSGIVIFGVIAALLLVFCLPFPTMLAGLGGGLVGGAVLALVGLRLTQFEINASSPHYYTPNAIIGIALSSLLAARILYRMGVIYLSDNSAPPTYPTLMQSPLTLILIGLTAGYYLAYNSGVLIRSRRKAA